MESKNNIYQGIQAIISSNNKEAGIWALERFLETYPDFSMAHNDLGVLYYNQGNKDKASIHYEKAANLQPENPVFNKNLADFYYSESGRTEEALDLYLKILKSHPEDIGTLLITGHISLSLKKFDDAKSCYRKILKIEPWNSDAQEFLDKVTQYEKKSVVVKSPDEMYKEIEPLLNSNNHKDAIDALERLLEADSDYALAHNDLGVLYYKEGNKNKALTHYEKAAGLMPENITFQKNLADFYYVESGLIKEALEIYVGILEENPGDLETLLITGHICVSLKKFDDAKVFYNRVLEIEPWNSDAREYLKKLENHEQTVSVVKSPDEMYKEIEPLLNSNNHKDAIDALERLLEADSDYALAHNDLGVLYYKEGNKNKALTHYEKAAGLMPENITFQKNLADFYYVESGLIKEALEIYVGILEENPGDLETLLITGHICVSLKKFDDAKVFYNRVLEIEPWNSDAFQSLEKLKDYEKAENETGYDNSFVIQENRAKNMTY